MKRRFATCRETLKPSICLENLPPLVRCHRARTRRVAMKKRIMVQVPCSTLFLAALLIEVSFLPRDLLAQTPFYQGKTITLVQGTAPGGSSDMMVKSVLLCLKKYIPGEPPIVPDYMPGGGGIKAANYLYKSARPDGLTIGNVGGGLVSNAVLRETGVLYDINKLIYLGSPHSHYHWVLCRGVKPVLRIWKPCARHPA